MATGSIQCMKPIVHFIEIKETNALVRVMGQMSKQMIFKPEPEKPSKDHTNTNFQLANKKPSANLSSRHTYYYTDYPKRHNE